MSRGSDRSLPELNTRLVSFLLVFTSEELNWVRSFNNPEALD
jgi:hypothetical protein